MEALFFLLQLYSRLQPSLGSQKRVWSKKAEESEAKAVIEAQALGHFFKSQLDPQKKRAENKRKDLLFRRRLLEFLV